MCQPLPKYTLAYSAAGEHPIAEVCTGCCWMSCDFTVETEEDNSEDQQEDKMELEMSRSDKTRTTSNTKTCLRMGQRKLLTDSKHYGKLSLGIWSWLIMTLKCPLHPAGRCSTPHYGSSNDYNYYPYQYEVQIFLLSLSLSD